MGQYEGVKTFRWDRVNGYTLLDSPSDSYAFGNAIDDANNVVGVLYDAAFNAAATYWDGNGVPYDLNTLIDGANGWQLSEAIDINNLGDIIGNGFLNGQQQTFYLRRLAAPVPEPGVLLLSASLGIVFLRSRRGKRHSY